MSQKRGLAVFFGCVIALVVAYAATYPRFHPQPAAVAAASAPAIASAASALSTDFPPLPPSSPLSWARLTPQQHVALAPFANQWDSFSDERKRKWLKIAARFPKMSPEAQKRLQERMTEWVRMTPEQRRVARENYLVSKDLLSAQAREKAWTAYQQLSPEQKEKLAAAERRRRPTVVSAPPTGKTDRDINRLVNAHDRHPASASAASTAPPAASGPAATPAAASTTTGAVTPPAAPTPVSPSEAPSLFNGS
ncbi:MULTISPECIES: DUF3106 domain-containing protein [Burkholderia]|uniref:DUF3106 domain-containing protein n=1 Tax=Burkholderia TaxID=32008 RepID=UPI000753D32E|nr:MULTISPECIES: DUF3106 domain-containing protein [Burkholderia]AOJ69490.1 hypothetical protein WS78_12535 [Burkholderia savannae]KVG41853.1 hypothetical protein WS77_16540 [Burkholderia sp. MSMB0265]KVG80133.1 hypothetical protein WS81_02470 [Burkholderia sp. MSMB2040]KVH01338.1 hypothetical protein WS82_21835 [Burkholderia sp. MSMB2041]KVH01695.1 hypothetical protein WS83_16710 [Burkholderia sp. MSMB2042]